MSNKPLDGTSSIGLAHAGEDAASTNGDAGQPESQRMEFAVFSHIHHKQHLSVNERLREFVEEVQLVDSAGFDYLFTAEHHFSRDFSLSPSQPITLTTIAQNSERIRFGPMTIILPISQPLRVAEEMLILDHMSNGRLEVGLGRGIVPHELISYGVRADEASERFREGLEFLIKAWTMDEKFSFLGKYSQYFDLEFPWRPLQSPHMPIWIPTATADNAREWGRRGYAIAGFSWLGLELHKGVFAAYREGWAERGNPPGGERLGYLSSYVVAETDEEARRLAEQHFPEQVALFDYEEGRSYWFGDTDVKRVYKGLLEMFAKIKQPENFDPPLIVVHGSPETVTERIRMLQDDLGINTIFGEFNFGLMPWETAQRSLKLFAEEVMPNFERTEAGALAATKA